MVVALKPGRFYGKSLPRPHIYNDIKFNSERVDPPSSINDALIRWASEAHWSMGGLSFKRKRMQGKIEGRIHKIRAEEEHHYPRIDDFRSPRKIKKGLAFDSQKNVLTKSISPIDSLLLADAKDRETAKDLYPKGTSVNRSSPTSKVANVMGQSAAAAKLPPKRAVKRALLVEDDSDSDDGLDEFLKDSGRPLRRSGRLQIATQSPKDEYNESNGDDTESRSMQMKQQQPRKEATAIVEQAKYLRRSSRVMKCATKS